MRTAISIFNRKFILALLVSLTCFFCLLTLSSCKGGGGEEDESDEVSPADMDVQVKIVKIETGEMPIMVKAVGVLTPAMQSPAMVVPLTAGIVSKVEVSEGQMVEAGAIIVRLDARRAENELAKAKAALSVVEADLKKASEGGLDIEQLDLDLEAAQTQGDAEQAKLDYDRQKVLLAENLISEKAVNDAQKTFEENQRKAKAAKDKADIFRKSGRDLELAQLKASVEQAKAEVTSAEFERQTMDIHAPQSGRISGLKVNVGSSVDDKTIVAQVIDKQTAIVRLQLSPTATENIEIKAAVVVRPISSKESLSGRVVSIGCELDDQTGLVAVEAQLEPDQQKVMRIGETVFAEIETNKKVKGFIVPASSISIEDDKASLFTVDDKQIAHAVPIEILTRTSDKAVVSSEALQTGAKVIVDGNYNLPDGTHVILEPTE
jgi:HlyD family secretion protein